MDIGISIETEIRRRRGDPQPAGDGDRDRHDLRHPGQAHQPEGHTEHDDRVQADPDHRRDTAVEPRQPDHLVDDQRDRRAGHRGQHDAGHGAPDIGHPQVTETAMQQPATDHGTGDEAETIGHAEGHDHLVVVEDHRSEQRQDDLDAGNAQNDPGRSPRLLAGIEHPQMNQHQRVWDQGERRPRHRFAEAARIRISEIAVPVECLADLWPGNGQEGDHRDQGDHGQPGRGAQVVDDRRSVVRGRIAAEPGHDRGQQGDTQDAVGQLQQQPRILVDRRPRDIGGRGHSGGDGPAELADEDVQDDRRTHTGELLEPSIHAPQRPQIDTQAADGRQQACHLDDDADEHADTEHQELRVAHADRVQADLTRSDRIQDQDGQYDQVVEHRRPGARFEDLMGIQDRHQQPGHAVEQDGR